MFNFIFAAVLLSFSLNGFAGQQSKTTTGPKRIIASVDSCVQSPAAEDSGHGTLTWECIASGKKGNKIFYSECRDFNKHSRDTDKAVSGGCHLIGNNEASKAVLQGSFSGRTFEGNAWICQYGNLSPEDQIAVYVVCK